MPTELAEAFRPRASRMAKAMVQEIRRAVPEYAQQLDGAVGTYTVKGIEQSILVPLAAIGDKLPEYGDWAQIFRELGKGEFYEGRSLDCLQTAYRVGGRVAWRHLAEFAQEHGVPADILCTAAEAVFAYVDELSALSVEGYTQAQARSAGTLARRRRRLLELILADPPASQQAIASLAETARWTLPEWVTMVALEPLTAQHERATPSLSGEILVDLEGSAPCLLVSDAIDDVEALRSTLRGWRAAIGPRVRLSDAAVSLQWARRTMQLVQRGVIPDEAVTRCSEHLSTLWLLNDEFLVRELTTRSLAPLRDLTVKQRARLSETLLAWLQSRGSAPELAEKLDVHPQTVRYRMHQLEDLFGDRLNDADERLNLEIALRAEQLLKTD